MPDLPASWVADPDQVTFAIKVLAGAVLMLGGILVAGAKWVAGLILKSFEHQFSRLEDKLDRVANSLEVLTLETSVSIAEIRATCKSNHPRP